MLLTGLFGLSLGLDSLCLLLHSALVVHIIGEDRRFKLRTAGFTEYITVRAFTSALFADHIIPPLH